MRGFGLEEWRSNPRGVLFGLQTRRFLDSADFVVLQLHFNGKSGSFALTNGGYPTLPNKSPQNAQFLVMLSSQVVAVDTNIKDPAIV